MQFTPPEHKSIIFNEVLSVDIFRCGSSGATHVGILWSVNSGGTCFEFVHAVCSISDIQALVDHCRTNCLGSLMQGVDGVKAYVKFVESKRGTSATNIYHYTDPITGHWR
jgi:hypothetical protein